MTRLLDTGGRLADLQINLLNHRNRPRTQRSSPQLDDPALQVRPDAYRAFLYLSGRSRTYAFPAHVLLVIPRQKRLTTET